MARVEQRMSDFGHVAAKPCDPWNRIARFDHMCYHMNHDTPRSIGTTR